MIEVEKVEGMLSGMTASVSVRIEGVDDAILIPIEADTAFSLRCYDVTIQTNTEKGGVSVVIQGTLDK